MANKEKSAQLFWMLFKSTFVLSAFTFGGGYVIVPREFDTYESKKHPESPIGLIFFVKFIGYILRDLA